MSSTHACGSEEGLYYVSPPYAGPGSLYDTLNHENELSPIPQLDGPPSPHRIQTTIWCLPPLKQNSNQPSDKQSM